MVEPACQGAAQRRVGVSVAALGENILVSFAPFCNEFSDRLGRVLQVGVHDDCCAPCRLIEPGRNGDFLAEIAAERDRGDATIGQMHCTQELDRLVGRAIVNEDDFETSRRSFQNGYEALQKRPDIFGFVQDRNNDAHFRLPVLAAIQHRHL